MKTKFLGASKITVTLNKKALQRDVFVGGERVIRATIAPFVERKIKEEQERLLEEFETHPVTQEIDGGNSVENSTGLLGGYGNLFSFIGFDEGSDPISPILSILKQRISYTIKRSGDYGSYIVTMNVPSKDSIFEAAQVKWMGGRSWADGIERGISGLNRYLYDEDYGFQNSLSGTGIQAKNSIRGVKQGKAKYISKILADFKKRLSRLL